jgi:DnaK suppressor protein
VTEHSTHDRLSTEKQATLSRIESLTSDIEDIDAGIAGANSDDEHDPEGSTLAFERARISTLLGQDRAYLEEIEQAQGRLVDGTYGACEWCGTAIPDERLAARPVARVCVQCRAPSG